MQILNSPPNSNHLPKSFRPISAPRHNPIRSFSKAIAHHVDLHTTNTLHCRQIIIQFQKISKILEISPITTFFWCSNISRTEAAEFHSWFWAYYGGFHESNDSFTLLLRMRKGLTGQHQCEEPNRMICDSFSATSIQAVLAPSYRRHLKPWMSQEDLDWLTKGSWIIKVSKNVLSLTFGLLRMHFRTQQLSHLYLSTGPINVCFSKDNARPGKEHIAQKCDVADNLIKGLAPQDGFTDFTHSESSIWTKIV